MAYDEVLAERLHDCFPQGRGKKMFGGYGFYLNDVMVAGVMADRLMVKLGDGANEAIASEEGVGSFAPGGGTPMRGWVTVDQELLAEDEDLVGWVERAIS